MDVTRRDALRTVGAGVFATAMGSWSRGSAQERPRPNILWISCEDISPHLGCYGYENARTPTLDQLAAEGTRYTHAFTVHGVCAPSRSGIITGMYPSSIGTCYMRCRAQPPDHIKCFPEYLREAGYYCSNNSKTDYNFQHPPSAWDESSKQAHWRKRAEGQRFFSVFNLTITHESQIRLRGNDYTRRSARLRPEDRQDPSKLTTLPPYYPDTAESRRDWAQYYELITAMDYQAADILKQLDEDGLADDTIVFFWSDHGVGLPRAKRWLYDSGCRVPLIVRIPEGFRVDEQGVPGTSDDQLISLIDLGPTVLNLAGVPVPEHMQGQPFLGLDLPKPRRHIFGARDRVDERYDIIRTVRERRYRYVRNYEPFRPYYQHVSYAEVTPTMKELRRLHAEGNLERAAEQFMAEEKPVEELYDLENDPHEVNNLASSRKHQRQLRRLRGVHVKWMMETRDLGLIPEAEVAEMEKSYGSRWAILRQPGNKGLPERLRAIVQAGEQGRIAQLREAMSDAQPSVRYWAAIWLGNHKAGVAIAQLRQALEDESAIVGVAAARALCMMDCADEGLPVLVEALQNENEWVRLRAATELDYLGETARPALDALRTAAQEDKNNYVKRLTQQAVRELEGGDA